MIGCSVAVFRSVDSKSKAEKIVSCLYRVLHMTHVEQMQESGAAVTKQIEI